MPSVEIICLEQTEPLIFNDLPFVVEAENKLVSHRSPSPLFQSDFDQLQGCIYHLGNRKGEHECEGYYTAYDLMNNDVNWQERIQFNTEFVPAIDSLLRDLIRASPLKTIIFTSDYQFGLAPRKYAQSRTLRDFWKHHDSGLLWINALYILK